MQTSHIPNDSELKHNRSGLQTSFNSMEGLRRARTLHIVYIVPEIEHASRLAITHKTFPVKILCFCVRTYNHYYLCSAFLDACVVCTIASASTVWVCTLEWIKSLRSYSNALSFRSGVCQHIPCIRFRNDSETSFAAHERTFTYAIKKLVKEAADVFLPCKRVWRMSTRYASV